MKKKLLASLLALVLLLGMLPMSALAEGDNAALGTAEQVTAEGTVTGQGTKEVVVTVNPEDALKWFPAQANIGRGSDGWWIGIKIVAPAGADINNVKFCRADESALRPWKPSTDGDDYMYAWGLATPAYLKQFEEAGKKLNYIWYFDWDGNESTGETVTAAGSNAELKGIDQTIRITFDPKDVVLEAHGTDPIWPEVVYGGDSYSADGFLALAKNGTLKLTDDVVVSKGIIIEDEDITLDLAGHKISVADDTIIWTGGTNNDDWSIFSVRGTGSLTINDTGETAGSIDMSNTKYDEGEDGPDGYIVDVRDGATVVIDCPNETQFIGAECTTYAFEGTITIKGGTYSAVTHWVSYGYGEHVFVLNCKDGNAAAGTAKIEVEGGVFVGVDPRDTKGDTANPTNYVVSTSRVTKEETIKGACPGCGENTDVTVYTVAELEGLVGEKTETTVDGKTVAVVTISGDASTGKKDSDATNEATEPENVDDALGAVSAKKIEVNASIAGDSATANAEITIPAETAATMGDVQSVVITANDVVVTLPTEAMDKIATEAAKDTVDEVKIVVKATAAEDESGDVTYTVSVEDGNGGNILPSSATDNGTIQITVPAPVNATAAYVYHVISSKPVELVEKFESITGGKITFTTTHLSDYLVTKDAQGLLAVVAPIEDHPTGDAVKKEDLGTISIGEITTADGTYVFTLTGDEIKTHANTNGTEGTWVGFGMPIDNNTGSGYSYTVNNGDVDTIAGRVYTKDGANYNTVYFKAAGEYTVVQKKDSETVATYKVTVVIHPLGTAYDDGDVQAANLTAVEGKAAPAYGHAATYSVGYDKDTKTITINATDLEKTKNPNNQEAYWVGLALKKEVGYKYASGFGTMPDAVADDEYEALTTEQIVTVGEAERSYVTTYWGANSTFAGKTGWLAVKSDSDGSVVKYTVKFNVTLKSTYIPGGGGGGSSATVTVPSASGGKVSVSDSSAKKGDTVTITTTPNTGKKVDTVTVTDAKGNKIDVTDAGNGKYTFVMPDGKVTVKVTFVDDPAAGKTVFTDVPAGAYYADAVAWAVEMGITNGTGANTFSPEAPCTRGQIVTFLWRAAGSPKASGANPFTDVKETDYFYDAVLWAVEKGITNGTGENTFSPANTCTRGQTVTFLYRYAGQPAAAGSNPFADVAEGAYYTDAVLWAVEKGITNGTGADTFSPANTCTRGQIVTFLYRGLAE